MIGVAFSEKLITREKHELQNWFFKCTYANARCYHTNRLTASHKLLNSQKHSV